MCFPLEEGVQQRQEVSCYARHRKRSTSPSVHDVLNSRLWLSKKYSTTSSPYRKDIPRCHGSNFEPWLRIPWILPRPQVHSIGSRSSFIVVLGSKEGARPDTADS